MRSSFIAVDSAVLIPGTTVVAGTLMILLVGALVNRGPERRPPDIQGILRCPAAAQQDLLSFRALQCWLDSPRGRWRILSTVSAHGALVVEAEATELPDVDGIAERLVAGGDDRFAEILIYVQPEHATDPTTIKRIRWTEPTGYEVLQFTASPMRE